MSYTRALESGHYIWPSDVSVTFDEKEIDNEAIDIFIYKLFNFRKQEFVDRIEDGREIISKFLENRIDSDKSLSDEDKKEIEKHLETIKSKKYMIYESSSDPDSKNIETFIDTRSSIEEVAVFFGTTFRNLLNLTIKSKTFESLSKEDKEKEIKELEDILKLIYEETLKDLHK